jgi:hypothetical protein
MLQYDAILNQLGYSPNEALLEQVKRIVANTPGFDRIEKHMLELHKVLQVDGSYVALSNSSDHFKIKLEAPSPELTEEARAKVLHFAEKYKVELEKVAAKDTYYILGYAK